MTQDLVTLTGNEIQHAAGVGIDRRMTAIKKGHKAYDRASGHNPLANMDHDTSGAICECAFAKWSGRFWSASAPGIDTTDFPGGIEVKGTKITGGHLIVQKSGKDEAAFVLVVHSHNLPSGDSVFKLCGWIYGREAKTYELRNARPEQYQDGSHWVPQSALRPMSELPNAKPATVAV